MTNLPLGKLPPELLEHILQKAPILDKRVVLGPGTGLDCAVVDNGENYLVFKSDPITFTAKDIGWYSVQINVNDLVTTGATPKWMMATLLLPEGSTTTSMVENISEQLFNACKDYGISLIGGHTEITHGVDRPLLLSTLIGEVGKDRLITPKGAKVGDSILLTKGVPIECIAIIASDFDTQMETFLTKDEFIEARNYLHEPGISIFKDSQLALSQGGVTAMHDPTEGGLAAALWELSIASHKKLEIDKRKIIIPPLAEKICSHFNINPLNSIASGALLFTVDPKSVAPIIKILAQEKIICTEIGSVCEEGTGVWMDGKPLERPVRDEIALLYER